MISEQERDAALLSAATAFAEGRVGKGSVMLPRDWNDKICANCMLGHAHIGAFPGKLGPWTSAYAASQDLGIGNVDRGHVVWENDVGSQWLALRSLQAALYWGEEKV